MQSERINLTGAQPVKDEEDGARFVFSNHQRHVERLLKHVDPYHIDEG